MHLHEKFDLTVPEIKQYVESYKAGMLKPKSRYLEMLRLLPHGALKILDYGCGWGGFSKHLAERGHDITGIDLSSNEIEICQTVWPGHNPKFIHEPIESFQAGAFDVVISQQVMEHTHNPGNYLAGINRVTSWRAPPHKYSQYCQSAVFHVARVAS